MWYLCTATDPAVWWSTWPVLEALLQSAWSEDPDHTDAPGKPLTLFVDIALKHGWETEKLREFRFNYVHGIWMKAV